MNYSSSPRLTRAKYRHNFHRRGLPFLLLLFGVCLWRLLVLADAWKERQRLIQQHERQVAKMVRRA